MRIVTTKKFRANQNTYMTLAVEEDVFITRPGGRLLRLSAVPDQDVEMIKKGYGKEPDRLITEAETLQNNANLLHHNATTKKITI